MGQNTQTESGADSEAGLYQRPDGRPKNTGRKLVDGVATIRLDDRNGGNNQITIHVEHPGHQGGTRCFWRRRDGDVSGAIRSHIRTELDDDVARIEVIDEAGVGLRESELLPRRMAMDIPGSPAPEVAIHG